MQRRTFLAASALAASSAAGLSSLFPSLVAAQTEGDAKRVPRILLRSSWQIVNIGDIAHTPGVLALIEKHIPNAETILWASADLSDEVIAMEHKRFPKLKVVKGKLDKEGKASTPELGDAVAWADFLLHGSGASLVASADVAAFSKHTQKPYGVYGITYSGAPDGVRETLTNAKFVFFRDTVSLAKAKEDGISCPVMTFGPDGAFACDLRNELAAVKFMKEAGLEQGKFVCCIPRLRYTPYWKIRGKEMTDEDRRKHARNEEMAEHDHAPLREAVAAVVRQTGLKVLVCPEDMTQMEVGKTWVVDKLPDDVKKNVVWREKYWMTDEALSVYIRSAGLFGNEMHSPIMCVGAGVPAIVCRWAEQTSKGNMWKDVGLEEWLFDFDKEADLAKLAPAVVEMVKQPVFAQAKTAAAREYVQNLQKETMAVVRKSLPSA